MKRCPQCLFIYPESDTRCDFDNTLLVVVDDAELAAATGQASVHAESAAPKARSGKAKQDSSASEPKQNQRSNLRKAKGRRGASSGEAVQPQGGSGTGSSKRSRKLLALTAVVGLVLGLVSYVIYYRLSHRAPAVSDASVIARVTTEPLTATPAAPPIDSPSPVEAASLFPSASASVKPAAERVATAHSNSTVAPVSTSGPGMGKKLGGKPVIVLTTGGKINADEVWRTRDGVWYRRDGIVTLLKNGRVKAIVNQ